MILAWIYIGRKQRLGEIEGKRWPETFIGVSLSLFYAVHFAWLQLGSLELKK